GERPRPHARPPGPPGDDQAAPRQRRAAPRAQRVVVPLRAPAPGHVHGRRALPLRLRVGQGEGGRRPDVQPGAAAAEAEVTWLAREFAALSFVTPRRDDTTAPRR